MNKNIEDINILIGQVVVVIITLHLSVGARVLTLVSVMNMAAFE